MTPTLQALLGGALGAVLAYVLLWLVREVPWHLYDFVQRVRSRWIPSQAQKTTPQIIAIHGVTISRVKRPSPQTGPPLAGETDEDDVPF